MDLRKERTLKLLGDSLKGLLSEKPYESITVAEICEGAMVRRATFYRHFGGKDELLEHVVAEERSAIDAQVDPKGSLPLSEYCHEMTTGFLRLIRERRALLNVQALSPEFSGVVLLFADEIGERFASKLREQLPDVTDAEIEVAASFYANGLVGAVRRYAGTNAPGTDDGDKAFLDAMDALVRRLFPKVEA